MHSKLPPSGASRWTVCTASVAACVGAVNETSVYADEGTTAHTWSAMVLQKLIYLADVPDEFRAHVGSYIATCEALRAPGDLVFVERMVPLWYLPGDIGTVDFAAISERGLHVRDLKYGAGVLVNSEDNKQLAIYAYSLICDLEDAGLFDFPLDMPVTIQAIQPRHHEWVDQPWTLTVGELRTFCEVEIEPAARLILGGHPTQFAPGEHVCRWCDIRGRCKAQADALEEGLPESVNPLHTFENLDAPDPAMLTHEQILSCFRNADQVRSFLKDVEVHVADTLLRGEPFEGCKVVLGRAPNREWLDETTANILLEKLGLTDFDSRYKTSLRSIPDIEKNLKEKGVDLTLLKPAITRREGKPVAALEEDKRPAITFTNSFTNLDDGET